METKANWGAAVDPIMSEAEPIHVLVVEDEFLISEWVSQSLSEQGFDVQTVSNAADALQRLGSLPVDVLFTDINLPGDMDGAALARRAREMLPHLPVVYASARATLLNQDARVPGSIIVPKPYEPALVGRLLAAATRAASSALPA
jgi:two-component system, response regulator PdtaR